MPRTPEQEAELAALRGDLPPGTPVPATPGQGRTPEQEAELQALKAGSTDSHPVRDTLYNTLQGLAKGADVVRVPGATAFGALTQLTHPDKDVFNMGEAAQGLNPLSLKMTPSSDEYMRRAGIKQGETLGDQLPDGFPYVEPGTSSWRPERHGAFDPTLRGAGGFLADMGESAGSSLVSMGAKRLAADDALEAMKAAPTGLAKAYSGAVDLAGKASDALTKYPAQGVQYLRDNAPKLSALLEGYSQLPSKVMGKVGDMAVDHVISPLVKAGDAKGKDVAEFISRYGITPKGKMADSIGQVRESLAAQQKQLLGVANKAGATGDTARAFSPAFNAIADSVGKQGGLTEEESLHLLQQIEDRYFKPNAPAPSLQDMQGWKSDIDSGLKQVFNGTRPDLEKKIALAQREGIDSEIKNAMAAHPDLGTEMADRYGQVNKDLGTAITIQPAADKMAERSSWMPFGVGTALVLSGEKYAPNPTTAWMAAGSGLAYQQRGRIGQALQNSTAAPLRGALMDASTTRKLINLERSMRQKRELGDE